MLIEPEEFENHSITSKVWRQLQVQSFSQFFGNKNNSGSIKRTLRYAAQLALRSHRKQFIPFALRPATLPVLHYRV